MTKFSVNFHKNCLNCNIVWILKRKSFKFELFKNPQLGISEKTVFSRVGSRNPADPEIPESRWFWSRKWPFLMISGSRYNPDPGQGSRNPDGLIPESRVSIRDRKTREFPWFPRLSPVGDIFVDPSKQCFQGKWCSTKLYPLKFWIEMTPRRCIAV